MSASFGSTNSSSASSNREEVEPIDAPTTATAVAAHVADAAITSSSIANTASVTVTTATATATTMSTEDLLELVKAIKFANPDYSQRDCYTEIVTVIPTKFPSYASLLNTTTINLNDVKKVWKKANSNTNNNNAAAKKQNEKITVAMALGAARLSLRIATTASRCRGGHVRDPINMPRDSGV